MNRLKPSVGVHAVSTSTPGTVHAAIFERVVTHADGAVGIQISQPVGTNPQNSADPL